MRFLAAGSAEELVIDHLDNGAVITYSELSVLVVIIESLGAKRLVINIVAYAVASCRLTTAVDAAAGTCHDLYHLIVSLALLDLFKKLSCIAET